MTRNHSILAVVDPAAAEQPAVRRAAAVARALDADLILFACIHEGLPQYVKRGAGEREMRQALLAHQLGYLKELAGGLDGMRVSTRAVWDRPLHEAIIRETLRSEPRLVVKDSHYHSAISRALLTNTDWHLIRDCPAPLWLVRGGQLADKPTVAACIDPFHEHDKPADLDRRILAEAAFWAATLGGDAHALHCLDHTALLGGAVTPEASPAGVEDLAMDVQVEANERLAELAAAAGIDRPSTHLRRGLPVEAIPAAARELRADVLVMGAVTRSRLQQAFVGSTAERVLDRLSCDVLVVKPARFESPVTYKPQASDFAEAH